jgi:hypothetical protein
MLMQGEGQEHRGGFVDVQFEASGLSGLLPKHLHKRHLTIIKCGSFSELKNPLV